MVINAIFSVKNAIGKLCYKTILNACGTLHTSPFYVLSNKIRTVHSDDFYTWSSFIAIMLTVFVLCPYVFETAACACSCPVECCVILSSEHCVMFE
jgi:hypothetical protein